MVSGTRGGSRGNETLRRLLARAQADDSLHAEALSALLDSRVYAGTWASSAEAVRTLTNSDGERAMPLFTCREELHDAAPRFGWLNPDGSLSARELDAREALESALAHGVHFVVIDLCSEHAREFSRVEIAEALEGLPAERRFASGAPRGPARSMRPAALKAGGRMSKAPTAPLLAEIDVPFSTRRPPSAGIHMAAVEEIVVPRRRNSARRPDPRVEPTGANDGSRVEQVGRAEKLNRSRPPQPRRARGSSPPMPPEPRMPKRARRSHADENSRSMHPDEAAEMENAAPAAPKSLRPRVSIDRTTEPEPGSAVHASPSLRPPPSVAPPAPPVAVAAPKPRMLSKPDLPSLPSLPSLEDIKTIVAPLAPVGLSAPEPPPLVPATAPEPAAVAMPAAVVAAALQTPATVVAEAASAPPPEAAPAAPSSDPSALRAPAAPLANEVLDAMAEALRKFPEVEWACELADNNGVSVIALRIEPSYMTRADEIRAALLATTRQRAVRASVLTLIAPAAMRHARAHGVAFFPWRKRAAKK